MLILLKNSLKQKHVKALTFPSTLNLANITKIVNYISAKTSFSFLTPLLIIVLSKRFNLRQLTLAILTGKIYTYR